MSNILVNVIIKKKEFNTGCRQNYFEVKEEWGIHTGPLEYIKRGIFQGKIFLSVIFSDRQEIVGLGCSVNYSSRDFDGQESALAEIKCGEVTE